MCPPEKTELTWSNTREHLAYRRRLFGRMMFRASGSAWRVIPSCEATYCKCSAMSVVVNPVGSRTLGISTEIVGNILCFSVVARMKIAMVRRFFPAFSRKRLKAAADSMCTSSMINTLYLPIEAVSSLGR